VTDEDAAELPRLIPQCLALLSAVASGDQDPSDAAVTYRQLHGGVRGILSKYGEPCICLWPNVYGWAGTAAKR